MQRTGLIAVCFVLVGVAGPAAALEVSYKAASTKSPDAIWSKIKGFCDITNALPTLKCTLSADGKIRTLTTPDGKNVVEKLEAYDDAGRSYGYMILDNGPLPVADYHSKIQVETEGSGSAIVWSGHFNAKGASDDEAEKVMEGIYKSGADTLAK